MASTLTPDPQNQTQSFLDLSEHGVGDSVYPPCKEPFVQGHDLRDIDHRPPSQGRRTPREGHIARCRGQVQVRCYRQREDGPDPAPIEVIGLYDKDRTPIAGFGTSRHRQLGPPDFAAPHHSSFVFSEWNCNASSPWSSDDADSSAPYTPLSRSVVSSPRVSSDELGNRRRIEFAPRHTQRSRHTFGSLKDLVANGNGRLHGDSMTAVIPTMQHESVNDPSWVARPWVSSSRRLRACIEARRILVNHGNGNRDR